MPSTTAQFPYIFATFDRALLSHGITVDGFVGWLMILVSLYAYARPALIHELILVQMYRNRISHFEMLEVPSAHTVVAACTILMVPIYTANMVHLSGS